MKFPMIRRDFLIYIACPYSVGDVEKNVQQSMLLWKKLYNLGFTPICPLWSHFQHQIIPLSWEEWMRYDLALLKNCNAVIRIPGESKGADVEEYHARHEYNIPVFKLDELELDVIVKNCDKIREENKMVRFAQDKAIELLMGIMNET